MGTTTHDEVIATEQTAVDHAYACYTAKLAEMTGTSAATASASGKDGIANRKHAEAQAEAYGGLGDEALVFSRVDAPDDPGVKPRPWYIGRRGVRDAENDPVVLLWTSTLAKRWAEALPEAPGEVVLRRRLRCVQRVVQDYFDEIAAADPSPASVPQPRPAADDATGADTQMAPETPVARRPEPGDEQPVGRPPSPTPGDVVRHQRRKPLQPDDFLLRELRRSRGGRMRDIVETIRRDQMDLVTGSPSDILVVQGGPGTGKSAVGLHRVTWLVNNEHFKAQDILVIGPHQRFLDYVGQVLPTLGTRDVNVVQLNRLWEGETLGTDTSQARQVKSDERMAAVLRRRVESDCRPEALDDLTTAPSYEGDEPAVVVTAGSTTLRVPKSEVLTLLDEARAVDGPYRQRRERFRSLFVDRLLQELATIAPGEARAARSVATSNATAASSGSSNASGRRPAQGRPCAASTTRQTSCTPARTASSTPTSRQPCTGPGPPPPTPSPGVSTTMSASKNSGSSLRGRHPAATGTSSSTRPRTSPRCRPARCAAVAPSAAP